MRPNPLVVIVSLFAAAVVLSASATTDRAPMLQGFGAAGSARELLLEKQFDTQLDPAQLREWMKRMAAAPNQVGSPHDKANAESMLELFKSWGWDAHIETFY